MIARKLPVRVGAIVRTVETYPYSLPEGLAHGVEVTVLSHNRHDCNHLVRDREGRSGTDRMADSQTCVREGREQSRGRARD